MRENKILSLLIHIFDSEFEEVEIKENLYHTVKFIFVKCVKTWDLRRIGRKYENYKNRFLIRANHNHTFHVGYDHCGG